MSHRVTLLLDLLNFQVFSGDQLNGAGTSYDSRSVLAKFAKPVIDREIPWCAVFGKLPVLIIRMALTSAGNHDSQIHGDRAYQMRQMEHMPFSLAESGPENVDGVGNCESF